MLKRLPYRVTFSAPCFIYFRASYQHPFRIAAQPLCAIGGVAAFYTDGQGFGYIFRNGQQLRNGFKGLSTIILIQSGHNHPFSPVGQSFTDPDKPVPEKLGFIDTDNLCFFSKGCDIFSI